MKMSIDLKSSVYRHCFLSPQAGVGSESGVELEKEENCDCGDGGDGAGGGCGTGGGCPAGAGGSGGGSFYSYVHFLKICSKRTA